MDILNWLYLRKNQLIRKTVNNSTTDLVVLGADATFAKRDDKYKTYAMTVEDFATAVALPPAYKVYTALLTQSGGSSEEVISTGNLTIGVTYLIVNNDTNPDWTNVGAPNNDLGTYFIATGTTPNSWGEGGLEYNPGAPVVTVLENTIGNIWFTYDSVGNYYANLLNAFVENKTLVTIPQLPIFLGADEGGLSTLVNSYGFDNDKVRIYCSNSSGTTDDALFKTPIEIRVYS